MQKKFLPILFAFIAVIFGFLQNRKTTTTDDITTKPSEKNEKNEPRPTTERVVPVRDMKNLRFRGKPVILTKHAKCRMDCRRIDASEIQEILNNGTINKRKSGQSKAEQICPSVALEGKTHDGQQVRIVVAECANEAKIVTVIDLKTDFSCSCD